MSRPGGRERILAAADALFRDRGFVDVSMQEIATAAGVTKAAPYYHFADKEELLGEVFVRVMDRLRQGVIARLAGHEPFELRLERVVEFLLSVGAPAMARLSVDAGQHIGRDRLADLRSRVVPPQEILAAAFAEDPSEEFAGVSPEAAAAMFVALVLGHVQLRDMGRILGGGDAAPSPVVPAAIVRGFLDGVRSMRPGAHPDRG